MAIRYSKPEKNSEFGLAKKNAIEIPVPGSDHIARHCSSLKVDGDQASMEAFLLRNGEEYLSVDWLERSGEVKLIDQIRHVVKQLAKRKRNVKASHRLARLNVGGAENVISDMCGVLLRFFGIRKPKRDTYSGIFDVPTAARDNEKVAFQLAILTQGDLHPNPDK